MTNRTVDAPEAAIHNHRAQDTDLADVAQALTDSHAHRPGVWQQDLKRANEALHGQGLLPGVDIVGVQGQDFVTRDTQGHTQLVDSRDTSSHRSAGAAGPTEVGGRASAINADGSGTVQASSGDSREWQLSQAMLKAEGVEKPTPNQMANYQLELERLNGRRVSEFKPGDQIKVPAHSMGGDTSSFAAERANTADHQQTAQVDRQYELAQNALKHAGDANWGTNALTTGISMEDINKALTGSQLTADDRAGLTFLRNNFSTLHNPGGMFSVHSSDRIYASDLTKAQGTAHAQIRQTHITAIGGDI